MLKQGQLAVSTTQAGAPGPDALHAIPAAKGRSVERAAAFDV
jgi:hypothetical protein